MKTLDSIYVLDKWDIAFISYCKSLNPTIEGAKDIWRKRNEYNEIEIELIVAHFIEIINILHLHNISGIWSLIQDAAPNNAWKYKTYVPFLKSGTEPNYYERWLMAIMSKLSLTEVKKLPGYVEMTNRNYDFWKTVQTYDE